MTIGELRSREVRRMKKRTIAERQKRMDRICSFLIKTAEYIIPIVVSAITAVLLTAKVLGS